MYSKSDSAWLKHWDFILLDLVMLQIAFVFSCVMRMGLKNPYENDLYLSVAGIICLADICVIFFSEPYHGIMRRGYFVEFTNVVRHVFLVGVLEVCYLFLTQNGEAFSRLSFAWFMGGALVFLYIERLLWKHYLISHKRLFYNQVKMLAVTSKKRAVMLIEMLNENSFNEYETIGIAYTDARPEKDETVKGIPAVCTAEEIPDYIQKRWVDAVFVRVKDREQLPEKMISKCIAMGVTVHSCLGELDDWTKNQYVNRMGGYTVLTTSVRVVSLKQMLLKRIFDICGGMVGLVITGILTIFLAPMIYIASPGPVFFSQVRIGKNGKRFRIYKFRSMYMDAEKRKKDLMSQNEMQGLMFKMEADPRIIGSGSDGRRHGLGWFLRKTSLDEFPQFWNVLKGDMSLVGTRPPTEDEWNQYDYYHRGRMAIKPGLTGMWQVSGRSDITDFEEVVKMDMEYVKNWNIGMDIKILLKTVQVVLCGSGSK